MRRHITRHRKTLAVAGAAALGLALLQQPATALPANIFELDGNSIDTNVAPPDPNEGGEDWDTLFADGPPAPGDPSGSSVAFTGVVSDVPNPTDASTFTGGGSKDDIDVPSWRHTSGTSPDKAEILNAYAAAYLAPDGNDPGSAQDLVLVFGSDRYAVNGSTNVGFWFTKQPTVPLANGTFSGVHETGDTLVLSEFTNGGSVPGVQVWRWDPQGTGPICPSTVTAANVGCKDNDGTLKLAFFGAGNCGTADACAAVNNGTIDVGWPYDAKGGGVQDGIVPTGGFIEGGINLSALSGGAQPCLSNFVAETRSSPSTDAVLLDFVRGEFPLCSASISIGPDDVNDVGDSHTFTVTVSSVFAGTTSGLAGVNPTVTLTDSNGGTITPTANTCDDAGGTDSNGQCSVTFTSNVAGVITGKATATATVQGQTFNLSTGNAQGQNPDAVKVFVDGKVSISPTATNGIGETHVFTVTAQQKIGSASSFSAATDGHADVTLTDDDAVNQVDAALTTCHVVGTIPHAAPHADNLDSNGQCVVVFKSDVAGTVTGHSEVKINLTTSEGSITITRATNGAAGNSGDAVKTFLDGTINWVKHDDLGALLGGAVFTVCKTHAYNSDTDTQVALGTPACSDVTDNSAPDVDSTAGEFKLVNLTLGTYTIKEKTAPPGYALDPDTETVVLDTTNTTTEDDVDGNGDPVVITFVDPALFKVIIYTCNTSTEELVVSSVDEEPGTAGGVKDTLSPTGLTAAQQLFLCGLDANYDNKSRGDHDYTVTIPKP